MADKIKVLIDQLIAQGRPKFNIFMRYARVELAPPSSNEFPCIMENINGLIQGIRNGAWKQVTVKEATINLLVTAEIITWFYIGEVIGKRHLVGYNV